ncbi:hypothetical protein PybrP1_011783 [[Pythium] brassicae (nom. inval.)]|nr:hypothetical protein PybrP1_011783 [[Pythium] brassicae (nom. inval.)]
MDEQRALLDELMGRNRDGDRPDEDVTDFRHARVCKRFLCGLCPHELFQNTKMDLGDCALLHTPALREQFERARLAQPQRDWGYEQELERELARFVADVEKRIARAQRRLEETDGAAAPSVVDVDGAESTEARAIAAEIQSVLRRAEEAGAYVLCCLEGTDGDVELALGLLDTVEELKTKMAMAQANAMLTSFRAETGSAAAAKGGRGGPESPRTDAEDDRKDGALAVNQKLRVCDVCGAFLSIFDSDRRLADHFGGKLHLGYLQIRRKIREIADARRARRRGLSGGAAEAPDSPACEVDSRDSRAKQAPVERERRDRHSRSRSRPRCVALRSAASQWLDWKWVY